MSHRDLDRKTREYSRGMRQKVGIIGALQSAPKLALLDEPTEGLDPLVKHSLLELMKEIRSKLGGTIFFSSHILSEVEQIADTAAIIRKGKIVASGNMEELIHTGRKKVTVVFKEDTTAEKFLTKYPVKTERRGKMLSFLAKSNLDELVDALHDFQLEDLKISDPTLELIFLEFYQDENE